MTSRPHWLRLAPGLALAASSAAAVLSAPPFPIHAVVGAVVPTQVLSAALPGSSCFHTAVIVTLRCSKGGSLCCTVGCSSFGSDVPQAYSFDRLGCRIQ